MAAIGQILFNLRPIQIFSQKSSYLKKIVGIKISKTKTLSRGQKIKLFLYHSHKAKLNGRIPKR